MKRDLSWLLLALLMISGPHRAQAEDSKYRVWGDLRGRYEGFWFRTDATGSKEQHRSRLRYRFRLNGNIKVNPHAGFEVQLGTGDSDTRSGNQTIGSPVDFAPNEIDIRRAYLIVNPFADGKLPGRDGTWMFHFGRVPNPFTWDTGKDLMLWDGDINFGGLSTAFDAEMGSSTDLFANGGYYVVDENGTRRDAFLFAGQLGLKQDVGKRMDVGARASLYHFDNLDADFIARGVDGSGGVTSAGGNIEDGLTGDPNGGKLQVFETQGYIKGKPAAITAYGGYSNNLSAKASVSAPTIGKQNQAFNVGVQVGSSKSGFGRIGVLYAWIEANAFPSQFIDSDLLDGITNRKGGLLYYARSVVKNLDFNFQSFLSDAIELDVPNPGDSVVDAKRWRNQVDFVFKF